jgi:large repetitive protein
LISGRGTPDDIATIYINGGAVGTARINVAGSWEFAPPTGLANGIYTVAATDTNDSGIVSDFSNTDTFTVARSGPVPPAPVVITPSNGAHLSNRNPVINGIGGAGALETIYINGNAAGTAPTDGAGHWSFTPNIPLSDGSYSVAATETDGAGNVSGFSNADVFTIDATPPAAPVVLTPTNGADLNTNRPVISGTGEANNLTTIYINGRAAGTAATHAVGNWSLTPTNPLPDGSYTVTATQTDGAGNISGFSNADVFSIDTTPPLPNVLTLWQIGYDQKIHHSASIETALDFADFDTSLHSLASAPWKGGAEGLGDKSFDPFGVLFGTTPVDPLTAEIFKKS